jgi:hypothetical protein
MSEVVQTSCAVCMSDDIALITVTPDCKHEPQCCEQCLVQYIKLRATEGCKKVKCPSQDCDHTIKKITVQKYAAEELKARKTKAPGAKSDLKSRVKIGTTTKKCPSCGVRIEKNGGCQVSTI